VFDPAFPRPPGTVPLWLWYNNTRGDNFTTSDAAHWDPALGSPLSGYTYVRIEGYIYSASVPGSCPLQSSYNGAAEDNYLQGKTSHPAPAGYSVYRTEGYMPAACP
jgi:hypothetical protein